MYLYGTRLEVGRHAAQSGPTQDQVVLRYVVRVSTEAYGLTCDEAVLSFDVDRLAKAVSKPNLRMGVVLIVWKWRLIRVTYDLFTLYFFEMYGRDRVIGCV